MEISEPSKQELSESIEELIAYRDRLLNEVLTVAQKLRIPQKTVDSAIENHTELKRIEIMLSELIDQLDRTESIKGDVKT